MKNLKLNRLIKFLVLTNNSILEVNNNSIYILKQIDFPYKVLSYNSDYYIFDKSKFIKNKQIFYLPINYSIIKFKIYEYMINSLDPIKLIVEFKFKNNSYQIYNFYFLINDNNNFNIDNIENIKNIDNNILKIIDTFLSLLRNIK